ncbi:putative GTP-binding protein 6 [Palaemon carinicauda]|uniref:putative GTP-binding protein 6 n=1 Tax=Palaemon carinicauda TaxID=392227 RepID=UPI0035B68658
MYSLMKVKRKFLVHKLYQSVCSCLISGKSNTLANARCSLPPLNNSRFKGKYLFSCEEKQLRNDSVPYKITAGTINSVGFSRLLSTTSVLSKKKKNKTLNSVEYQEDSESQIDDSVLADPTFDAWRNESDILGFISSHENYRFDVGVLVLQPWVKWGPRMKKQTTPEMMLDEAAALVATLPGVRVIRKEVAPVRNTQSKMVFGSGTLERLVSLARSSEGVSAVFISIDMLKNIQVEALQEAFGLKVLDRYSVVLGIFRHHARTKEAKLQVALAELPYIKSRLNLRGDRERLIMMNREKRLRNTLDDIASNRAHIRQNRKKSDIPTIAVVGYTNSGKTSLIHAITGDMRAEGKNQLFATLDVTGHGGKLPCGVDVILIDTVGFIQEIPTDLIASFRATLEDAICADLVVHVRDAKHPDYELQGITVEKTLATLPLPESTPVITIANKVDLITDKSLEEFGEVHFVSCMTGQGLDELMTEIETQILKVTGRKFWRFTLPTGSDEISWLRKATGLVSQEMDEENPQVTRVVAVMTDQEIAAYKRNFRK